MILIEDQQEERSGMLRDANLRERLQNNAYQHSKEFDWQIGAEKTMEVIGMR